MTSDTLAPPQEQARLRALSALQIVHTAPEERFDLIVRLAQRVFDMPAVAVTLIDADEQWVKSKVGTDYCAGPRAEALCNYTIQQAEPLIIPNALADERFHDHSAVTGPAEVRFYAGQPLTAPGGYRVGTLCMWDSRPRELTADEVALLKDLGRWVEKELAAEAELQRAAAVQRGLLPRSAPVLPGYDVAGGCFSALSVGGDFFDFYRVGEDLQLTIADVMGKGTSAALIAAGVRAVMRGANRFNDVAEAINRAAFSLENDLTETSTFVTMFSLRLDPATGRLSYVDAGHGLAAIVRRSGAVQQLASHALPLGALTDSTWRQQYAELAPGDTFITVSDGWLEFFDTVEQAASEAVRVVLESSSAQSVVDQMGQFGVRQVLVDDLTVVVARRSL